MTVPLTPLTAIAQTPRKEHESKFTFNPHLAKVNPDPQIQSKLGNYSLVKHLLEKPKRLFGIDGIPQSPASPAPSPNAHKSQGMDSSGRSCSPSSGQEFKKPGGGSLRGTSGSAAASSSSGASHQQRGGFVKPADGKPPYGGRGGYPGQPVKHGGGGSNDHRSHGLLPAKGPPLSQPQRPLSPVGNNGMLPICVGNIGGGGGLASRTQFAGRLKLIEVNESNSRSSIDTPDVENILKQVTKIERY